MNCFIGSLRVSVGTEHSRNHQRVRSDRRCAQPAATAPRQAHARGPGHPFDLERDRAAMLWTIELMPVPPGLVVKTQIYKSARDRGRRRCSTTNRSSSQRHATRTCRAASTVLRSRLISTVDLIGIGAGGRPSVGSSQGPLATTRPSRPRRRQACSPRLAAAAARAAQAPMNRSSDSARSWMIVRPEFASCRASRSAGSRISLSSVPAIDLDRREGSVELVPNHANEPLPGLPPRAARGRDPTPSRPPSRTRGRTSQRPGRLRSLGGSPA